MIFSRISRACIGADWWSNLTASYWIEYREKSIIHPPLESMARQNKFPALKVAQNSALKAVQKLLYPWNTVSGRTSSNRHSTIIILFDTIICATRPISPNMFWLFHFAVIFIPNIKASSQIKKKKNSEHLVFYTLTRTKMEKKEENRSKHDWISINRSEYDEYDENISHSI